MADVQHQNREAYLSAVALSLSRRFITLSLIDSSKVRGFFECKKLHFSLVLVVAIVRYSSASPEIALLPYWIRKIAARLDFRKLQHGCEHYRRRCKLRAPCCNKVFSCHHCHNKYTSELKNPKERHKMVRQDVQQVVCIICNMEQPVSQICGNCGVKMGEYFCGICKLFDDDTSKQQFHCDDCGICRLYGRENVYHCDKCGCCYANEKRGSHTCVENILKNECPGCHEYLFETSKKVTLMYCGHSIHVDCYSVRLRKNRTSCPICSKLSISREVGVKIKEEISH
ncbi:hypothetical protein L2E82_48217 [Cichorium intybus]|uniref:Uncharacterized protein n=1 Tax=Cichorium intybus TaxID=13427 RepID=A0ACB8YWV1_CICIN|nr:hypothetical protein L2E82_48217 [Cichorium intybus]